MDERRWELLVRLFSGEASPVERDEMDRWMAADPAHVAEVESLRALWEATGTLPRRGNPAAAWQKVAVRTGLALLAIGVLAFAWIGRNLSREEAPPVAAVPEPAEREVPALAAG